MDSSRRAELLASLSPEGRATYEVLKAQLARDLDRCFAESKTRLEKGVEAAFGDLRRKCSRVPSRDNAEHAKGIAAVTATATATYASSSTASSTSRSCPRSSVIDYISTTAPRSTASANCCAAASVCMTTATGISVSTPTSATPASSGVPSLVASATTHSTSLGGDTGAAPAANPLVSTGPIGVPASTMQREADDVHETPVTCSTFGLYPVANAIQINKVPLPQLAVSLARSAAFSTSTSMTAVSASDDSDLALATPTMYSTECPGEDVVVMPTLPRSAPTSVILPPEYSPSPPHEPLDVLELVSASPTNYSTNCSAAASSPELTVQAGLSPSTCSSSSAHEDAIITDDTYTREVFVETEAMSLTASAPTESRTSQSLRLIVDRVLHSLLPTKCLTIVCEFLSSQAHLFLSCEVTQTAAPFVCLPILQWDENCVWPPPFSQNALALRLQVYGQKTKCSFLEHDQSGVFLIACRTVFQYIFVYQVTFIGSLAIDKLQRGVAATLHQKKLWPSWEAFFYGRRLQFSAHVGSVIGVILNQHSAEYSTRRVIPEEFQWAYMWKLLQGFPARPCLCCEFLKVDKLRQYFISLAELQPWHYWELSFLLSDNDQLGSPFVQWEIAWTNCLAPGSVWFQSCYTEHDSSYGCESLQWTIAWCSSSHIQPWLPIQCLQQGAMTVSAIDGMAFDSPLSSFSWSPDGCFHGKRTQPFIVIIDTSIRDISLSGKVIILQNFTCVGYLASPWDTGHQSPISLCQLVGEHMSFQNSTRPSGLLLILAPGVISLPELFLTWDSGESLCFPAAYVVDAEDVKLCSSVPWDPGGSPIHLHRLGGKPNFMEGGLSATWAFLGFQRISSPAWSHKPLQIQRGWPQMNSAWTRTAASAEACVCGCVLVSSSLVLFIFLPLLFSLDSID